MFQKFILDLPPLSKLIQMKYYALIFGVLFIWIVNSCTTQKLTEAGQNAYQAGNYDSALHVWSQVIEDSESKGRLIDTSIYYKAGLAAMQLERMQKARKYLEKTENTGYSRPQLYTSLAHIYKGVDNLSKEITALENYHSKYPEGAQIDTITMRLFETYVESENWQKAVNLWPEVEERAQSNADLLTAYLIVNQNLDNNEACENIARKLIRLDADNQTALEWYARKYFWKAENLYVTEMKAYKNNRTRSQYNKLLKAWDQIWPDFRKSRDYFLKLYKLDPQPKYAKFLWNIYKRMDKQQKAAYYKKLWKQ